MLLSLIHIIAILLLASIRVAQEYERALVFRLGRFTGLRGPGIYWIIPLIERQQTVDIRTKQNRGLGAAGNHYQGQRAH